MNSISIRESERVLYFDNIRYLMVLLVVVLHVACSYSYYTPWWTVNDDNSVVFDFVLRFLGVFLMPTLFFIAGYFALPSLHRKGTWLFVKSKLIRLGIPWLIGVSLLGPVRLYMHDYSRGYEELDLGQLFVVNTKDLLSMHTGFIESVYHFNHSHFWFISLLFFFFLVFALLHRGKGQLSETQHLDKRTTTPTYLSVYAVLLLVTVLTIALTLSIYWLFSAVPGREPWLVIASVIQFQITRVCLYGICFGLGIYVFHCNWFSSGRTPGKLIYWIMLTSALWLAMEMILARMLSQFTLTLGVLHVTLRTFLVFSVIMTLVAFGAKYWQSDSRLNRSLAKNSYTIYLIHMVIVFLIQLLMYKWWNVSIYIKFMVGTIVSLTLSYLLSEFVVRRYPRSSIAGMVTIFAVLALILN